jgi:hypothetical protein
MWIVLFFVSGGENIQVQHAIDTTHAGNGEHYIGARTP